MAGEMDVEKRKQVFRRLRSAQADLAVLGALKPELQDALDNIVAEKWEVEVELLNNPLVGQAGLGRLVLEQDQIWAAEAARTTRSRSAAPDPISPPHSQDTNTHTRTASRPLHTLRAVAGYACKVLAAGLLLISLFSLGLCAWLLFFRPEDVRPPPWGNIADLNAGGMLGRDQLPSINLKFFNRTIPAMRDNSVKVWHYYNTSIVDKQPEENLDVKADALDGALSSAKSDVESVFSTMRNQYDLDGRLMGSREGGAVLRGVNSTMTRARRQWLSDMHLLRETFVPLQRVCGRIHRLVKKQRSDIEEIEGAYWYRRWLQLGVKEELLRDYQRAVIHSQYCDDFEHIVNVSTVYLGAIAQDRYCGTAAAGHLSSLKRWTSSDQLKHIFLYFVTCELSPRIAGEEGGKLLRSVGFKAGTADAVDEP